MSLTTILFYFFEAAAAVSAVSILFTKNVFYGALLLVTGLLALAGIYVLAFAEFVAVTQILVYAGGILVVIIFGIMLTTKISGKPLVVTHANVFGGAIASASFLALLTFFILRQEFPQSNKTIDDSGYNAVNKIGIGLMSDFALPFEVAGILLLVTLIGAAVIASFMKSKKV